MGLEGKTRRAGLAPDAGASTKTQARSVALDTAASSPALPAFDPLLVRAPAAARLCGIAPRTWRRLAASRRVPSPVRLGGSVLWRVDELRAWCADGCQPRDQGSEATGSATRARSCT